MKATDIRPLRAVNGRRANHNAKRNEPTSSDRFRERDWAEEWARHYGDIVRYATHLLSGDTHAAEDVAQETAIRLWQHTEVLHDGQPLGGWLRRVAHNIVVDRVRRRSARPTEVALAPGVDSAGPDEFATVDAESAVTGPWSTSSTPTTAPSSTWPPTSASRPAP